MVVTIIMFPKGWVAWSKSWGNLLCAGRLPGGDFDQLQLVTLLEVTRWKVSFFFEGEKSWRRALLAAGEGGMEGGGNQVEGNCDDAYGDDDAYGEDGGDDAYGEDGDDEYGEYDDKNKEKEWHLIIVATCAIVQLC